MRTLIWHLTVYKDGTDVSLVQLFPHTFSCLLYFNFNFNRGTLQNPLGRHLDKVLVFPLARRQSHQRFKIFIYSVK